MATLTIAHYLYLNKEQRYKLHAGETLEVVGISIPVWFHKGNTSEPAKELFCRYKLTNRPKSKTIMPTEEGYCINLPQKLESDKEENEVYDAVNSQIGHSEMLLDIKDGGSEYLEFRQYNKVEQENHSFNVVHFVEIKPNEILEDTMC
jgi:hypothetical protein